MTDSVVETVYRVNMNGQYIHTKGNSTSIVDIKITLESSDRSVLGKVGEAYQITIRLLHAPPDQFENATVEHHGNNEVVDMV